MAIHQAPGVLAVQVDYASGLATIGTDPDRPVPHEEILDALIAIGYTGRFVEMESRGTVGKSDDERAGGDEPTQPDALHDGQTLDHGRRPRLPDEPFDYSAVRPPAHANPRDMAAADNTPDDNSITDAGATLGRVLFYDKKLSKNDSVACASCHSQRTGFADPRRFSVGFENGRTTRNAMSLANLRYSNVRGGHPGFFWDERAATLEAQALTPIQDPVEMGMSLGELEAKLQRLAYYPPLFQAAFGSPDVTSDRIAKALAQFLRSLVSWNAKFDRAASQHTRTGDYAADFDEFTAEENLGKSLFLDGVNRVGEHGCAVCHVPPTFGMTKAMNNGLELKYADRGLGALGRPPNDPFTPSDDGKFKAPSLRNIALTAPYMHDGRFEHLEQVVDHYSHGVRPHANLGLAFEQQNSQDAKLGFDFTERQKAALVAFLKTLTDEQFLTDPRFSDPFEPGDAQQDPSPAERYKALVAEYAEARRPREFAPRFLELAERDPKVPAALDALVWIVTNLPHRPETTRAIGLLQQHQLESEKLGDACRPLARTVSPAAEELLRAALDKSPHVQVRARACFHLAELLEQQASLSDQLKKEPGMKPRAQQYYGKELTEHLSSLDRSQVEMQRELLYERMIESFADVPVQDSTMGRFAERALFALRHLAVGKVAPNIDGEDIDGERFRLSDYRGKVVMLSFWGHW